MKLKKIRLKKSDIAIALSTVTAILVVFITHKLNVVEMSISNSYRNDKEAIIEIVENVYGYRTPFTIDYTGLEKIEYTNYQCADPFWESNYKTKYKSKVENLDLHGTCWAMDRIAKIRNDFQRKTVKAKLLGSVEINNALDEIELGFDEVLDYYFGHDYYMRAFTDAYLAVMPEKFDNLVKVLKIELRSSKL